MPTRVKHPFIGEYPGVIDDKNRLSIPAEFRRAIPAENEDRIVLMLGNLSYLYVLPKEMFIDLYETARQNAASFATLDALAIDTLLAGKSADRELDSQGRITVPTHLMKQAGIAREVTFVGHFDHFVMWDKYKYVEYLDTVGLNPGQAWQRLIELSQRSQDGLTR